MDELKTKFNIGDKCWYIQYVSVEEKCPRCGNPIERYEPKGVEVATVKTIFLQINKDGIEERYELQIPWKKDTPLFVVRSVADVFPDSKTAYRKYKEELEEEGYEE